MDWSNRDNTTAAKVELREWTRYEAMRVGAGQAGQDAVRHPGAAVQVHPGFTHLTLRLLSTL